MRRRTCSSSAGPCFRRERARSIPNGLRLTAYDGAGNKVDERTFFSIGGGFIVEDGAETASSDETEERLPYPFHSAAELLEVAHAHGLSIDQVMMANECARMRVHDSSASDADA